MFKSHKTVRVEGNIPLGYIPWILDYFYQYSPKERTQGTILELPDSPTFTYIFVWENSLTIFIRLKQPTDGPPNYTTTATEEE